MMQVVAHGCHPMPWHMLERLYLQHANCETSCCKLGAQKHAQCMCVGNMYYTQTSGTVACTRHGHLGVQGSKEAQI
jgi:hypothetical protein